MYTTSCGQENIFIFHFTYKFHQHNICPREIHDVIDNLPQYSIGGRCVAFPAKHDQITMAFSRRLKNGARRITPDRYKRANFDTMRLGSNMGLLQNSSFSFNVRSLATRRCLLRQRYNPHGDDFTVIFFGNR